MDSTCPNCNKIPIRSGGDCKHGHCYFRSYPRCLICGNSCPFDTVSIGPGSEFDTGYVCAECAREYIDPAIKAAQAGLRPEDAKHAQVDEAKICPECGSDVAMCMMGHYCGEKGTT